MSLVPNNPPRQRTPPPVLTWPAYGIKDMKHETVKYFHHIQATYNKNSTAIKQLCELAQGTGDGWKAWIEHLRKEPKELGVIDIEEEERRYQLYAMRLLQGSVVDDKAMITKLNGHIGTMENLVEKLKRSTDRMDLDEHVKNLSIRKET